MAATWQAAVQFPRRTIKAMTTRQRLKAMALLQPRDNRRKIVTFVRLYQPQQGDDSEQNEQLHSSTAPDNQQPIVNLTRGKTTFVKSVNTFRYYFHSCNKILFVARSLPLAVNEIQALSVYEFTLASITLLVLAAGLSSFSHIRNGD